MWFLLGVSSGIDWINHRLGQVAEWLVLLACLVSASNAAVRYVFSYSSNAFLEIQWYMFGAMVMLGASYTLKMNEHVRVDIIYSMISDRGRLWVDLFGIVVFLLPVTIFLAALCWPIFEGAWLSKEVSANAGGLILWPIKFMLPFGFIMLTLQGISELIKRVAALRGDVELELKYEKPLQ
jgi:TRAP-type mannitol/chloroaromatic compound transport system permease small subunit